MYCDAEECQFPQGVEAVAGVSGESGNRLDEHRVELASSGVTHHAEEVVAAVELGAGDTLVGVHIDQFPIGALFDQCGVVADLCGVGVLLIAGVGADAHIHAHAPLPLCLCDGVDHPYRCHVLTSVSAFCSLSTSNITTYLWEYLRQSPNSFRAETVGDDRVRGVKFRSVNQAVVQQMLEDTECDAVLDFVLRIDHLTHPPQRNRRP